MENNQEQPSFSTEGSCHFRDSLNQDVRGHIEGVETGTSALTLNEGLSRETDNLLLITSLPEVVLVNIMEYLSLKDRYHLSVTCSLFYGLFSHPHLWRVAHISLYSQESQPGRRNHRWKLTSIMHQTMAEIVNRFSHLFQHLSLEMFHHVQPFDDNCRHMLERLNEECRLESLTLRLGSLASNDEYVQRVSARSSNFDDLPLIVGLVKKAVRLKRLNLISWPLHMDIIHKHDIFQALLNNEKLKNLESLNIFYIKAEWTERNPKLPSQEMTFDLVSHFRSLTHLALRSPMLNNEIIFELASKNRSRLTLFQILIVYSKDTAFQEGYKVPEISSKAWKALRMSSPELKVEYLSLTRIPQGQMNVMLLPEVPLSSMVILTYGRCDQELVETLTLHYKSSLEKFICLCEASGCDQSVMCLVDSCPQLKHLIFHGKIRSQTIMKMADIIKQRGVLISGFHFKESSIQTNHTTLTSGSDSGGEDDDVVVAKEDEGNEYYLVGLRSWHEDDFQRQHVLHEVAEYVSVALGYKWRPDP